MLQKLNDQFACDTKNIEYLMIDIDKNEHSVCIFCKLNNNPERIKIYTQSSMGSWSTGNYSSSNYTGGFGTSGMIPNSTSQTTTIQTEFNKYLDIINKCTNLSKL